MPDKNRKEVIRTVRGDIQPAELGMTNVREHLLMRSPLLRGDELDDVERSAVEAERIVLDGDVARRSSFRAYGGMPGMVYLPQRFIPRLREGGSEELVQQILVTNPARFLAFAPNAI